MRKCFFIVFLVCVSLASRPQDLPATTQQQLENVAETNEEEPSDDNLLQQLDYFRKHPVNLNTATTEELQALKVLTDLQIANLVHYRNVLGNLVSIYELQALPTWDILTIRKVLPYIFVGAAISIHEDFALRFRNGDKSVLFRFSRVLEKSKGFNKASTTHYLGDRNRLMFRYRYQYKDLLYFGITGDKDAGEQFFKGAQSKGFDFYSFHFFARRIGIIKSVALGDYTVNLGQGLIQWQSLAFGKSSEVMSIKRQAPVLIPYRSAGEFYFNRGAAVTVQKKWFEATVFGSYKKISGNVIKDSVDRFSSLLTSGYYRTPSEIADKNQIGLTSFGGNLNIKTSSLKMGLNGVAHYFNIPLQKRNEPYNLYAINGKELYNSSIDYSYTYKNIHFFGEAAVDRNIHKAFVSGVLLSVDPKVDVSFLYRNVQKEYQSLFGNAFTENSLPVNEKGLYSGIAIRPLSGWQLNAYADFFQFPWIKYLVNAPTRGHDYLVELNYQPNKQFGMYVRFRNKNKPADSSGNGVIYYPQDRSTQNLRIHLTQQLFSNFSFAERMEILWLNNRTVSPQRGYLIYIQGNYKWKTIAANLRLQYFETDGYDSRIYVYESDVLYSFSIPSFFYKGFRYYINFNYQFARNFEAWLRCTRTLYSNRTKIGSGLDEIDGDRRTEIKIQLRYLF